MFCYYHSDFLFWKGKNSVLLHWGVPTVSIVEGTYEQLNWGAFIDGTWPFKSWIVVITTRFPPWTWYCALEKTRVKLERVCRDDFQGEVTFVLRCLLCLCKTKTKTKAIKQRENERRGAGAEAEAFSRHAEGSVPFYFVYRLLKLVVEVQDGVWNGDPGRRALSLVRRIARESLLFNRWAL